MPTANGVGNSPVFDIGLRGGGGVPPTTDSLLLESGDFLLLETGDKLLIE